MSKAKDLTAFAAGVLEHLLAKPRTTSETLAYFKYRDSLKIIHIKGQPVEVTAYFIAASQLSRLASRGLIYCDKSKRWHLTELGINVLLNYWAVN